MAGPILDFSSGRGAAPVQYRGADLPAVAALPSGSLIGSTPLAEIATPALHEETLEEVLRSLITVKPGSGATRSGRSVAESDDGGDNLIAKAYREAYRALLDSEALGEAVRWIAQTRVSARGRKVFSLFGYGEFELDVSADDGEIAIAELTSGTIFPLSEGRGPEANARGTLPRGGDGAVASREPGDGHTSSSAPGPEPGPERGTNPMAQLAAFLARVSHHLSSPEGRLLLILAWILLALLLGIRLVLRLAGRRRPPMLARPHGWAPSREPRPAHPAAPRPLAEVGSGKAMLPKLH